MASTEQVEQSLKDLNEAVSCGMDNAEPERAFESICFADVVLNKLISNSVIQVPSEDELNYFNEIDRFEAVFPGSDKRMRMDGCLILPNGHGELDLHIFVTDYERRVKVEKITKEEVKKLSSEAYYFIYNAGEESFKNQLSRERSAYEVCNQIIKNKAQISSVFIWILSNRFANEEYSQRANITLWGQPVELVQRVVDLSYLADSDAERAHSFLDFSPVGGIDVLKLNLGDNSQFDCYLASIPANYLVQIYSAYGTRLIEKNVRAYLGNKKANKGIESTIKEAPETFVALNNGLVMVAEDVETSLGKLKKLKNFQIVNGGQTTATLYYTFKAAERMKKKEEGKRIKDNFAKIQVPLKIVRIKKTNLESNGFDFAAQIPIAANTQNAIKASDLSASVKYYQEFEKISRELTTSNGDHWFFERARGSYKAEEAKFIGQRKGMNLFRATCPKEKMFDKTDLAVSALCWDLKPKSACKGAQLAFLEFNEGVKERIPDVKEVKELICKWMVFSTLERRLKEDNFKNPRTIVNYSIYLFSKKYRNRIDWSEIWSLQEVPEEILYPLTELAKKLDQIIRRNMGNQMINMFARKDQCLELVDRAEISLDHPFETSRYIR